MSEGKPMVTWECDRCHKSGATLPTSEQPKGWLGVRLLSPPRRDPADSPVRWVLCPNCGKSLAAWKAEGGPE